MLHDDTQLYIILLWLLKQIKIIMCIVNNNYNNTNYKYVNIL